MITLDNSLKLEVVTSAAVSTSELAFTVSFKDIRADKTEGYGTQRTDSTSTTDAVICSAPRAGTMRIIEQISVHNRDNASVTFTIKTDDGTTEVPMIIVTLATLENGVYETNAGWIFYTSAGAIK